MCEICYTLVTLQAMLSKFFNILYVDSNNKSHMRNITVFNLVSSG